jgi:glycosyltransferase involved in cell wall biosynthesis
MLASLRPPRRVLLTTDTVGGVWTYTLDLARALVAEEIAVELVVLGPAPSLDQQHEAASINGLHLTMLGLPLDWMARDREELREASRTFFALARTMAPDVIHLNSPGLATEAHGPAPLVIGLHSCVASWWQAVYPGVALPPDLAWRTEEVRRGLARADMVVAPSEAFARRARAIYGPRIPIEAIRNGRDAAPAADVAKEPVTVLTAGRLWDEAKDIATLDRAAAALPVPVHAAGPTRDPQTGKAAGEFGNLSLLGNLPTAEMRRWLARAGIFVSPAIYEPFGLGVLEAAQAGCALVLCDNPTFRELWDGAAIFVPAREAEGFADAIGRLVDEPARRAELAAKARRRAARYELSAMSSTTLNLYSRLAEAAAPLAGEVA